MLNDGNKNLLNYSLLSLIPIVNFRKDSYSKLHQRVSIGSMCKGHIVLRSC